MAKSSKATNSKPSKGPYGNVIYKGGAGGALGRLEKIKAYGSKSK